MVAATAVCLIRPTTRPVPSLDPPPIPWRAAMNRAKILIAATTMVTLSASLACAGGTNSGSNIINGQINLQSQFSNLTGNVDTIQGDAVVQGAAAGNLIDIT